MFLGDSFLIYMNVIFKRIDLKLYDCLTHFIYYKVYILTDHFIFTIILNPLFASFIHFLVFLLSESLSVCITTTVPFTPT